MRPYVCDGWVTVSAWLSAVATSLSSLRHGMSPGSTLNHPGGRFTKRPYRASGIAIGGAIRRHAVSQWVVALRVNARIMEI